MKCVIIAGGKGTRLFPLTKEIPKALVKIGEIPILEIIIKQLSSYDICDITLATNHYHEKVFDYFGHGDRLNVRIKYIKEKMPLGTAGSISLLENIEDDFMVMNCDILTNLNFDNFIGYHLSQGNHATILSVRREEVYPYGTLKIVKGVLDEIIEKPKLSFDIYGGISVFKPSVIKQMKSGERRDLPTLLTDLCKAKHKVSVYNFDGLWIDIGSIESYAKAVRAYHEIWR
mgnify:CR=1 FL=1